MSLEHSNHTITMRGASASTATVARSDPWQRRVTELLRECDIRIGGDRRWDMCVHNRAFYRRVMTDGSLGLGESYMEGWWDAEALDELVYRLIRMRIDRRVRGWSDAWLAIKAWLLNPQTRRRSRLISQRHYDLGNDLYAVMLGARLVYSCGYWRDADTLDEAQSAKLDLVCRKLGLQPGMHVLDIGCGFGDMLAYASECYGVSGVGVTISNEQAAFARKRCTRLPIEIRLEDYRDTRGRFDRVISIGMFEHVGSRNYDTFFTIARKRLADDGLFLLHTIGGERSSNHTDPWIEKYIFPNSMLPSAAQIAHAVEGRFVIEDWHNFGADYDRTLMAWRVNFDAAWPRLAPKYGERFARMWRFYLAASAASFRARRNQLWQLVLSPEGVLGGYRAPR